MPLTMYWVLERRDTTGNWHAMVSNPSLFRPDAPRSCDGFEAGCQISANDPAFFAVMSGHAAAARGRVDPNIEPYARPGLPLNASQYARDLLCNPIATGQTLRKATFHDPGHVRLHELAEIAKKGRQDVGINETLSGNAVAEDYLSRLFKRLETVLGLRSIRGLPKEDQPNLADREILVGTITEFLNGNIRHDEMDGMSKHAELAMTKKMRDLMPCTPENLRLLFAYGM